MKKKIFCIITVFVLLISTLAVSVSASQRPSEKDYYTWSYEYANYGWSKTYPDNIQFSVKVPFYYLDFTDSYTVTDGDFAKRTYYADFSENISYEVPYISTSQFDRLEVTDSFIYYEEGWHNFAYKTKFEQSMDDANTVTAYDPFKNYGYTSYTIYNYIRRIDDTEHIGGVTEVVKEVTNSHVANEFAYGYEFSLSGIYEVKSLIAFYNSDTLEYRTFVGDTYTVNVAETTLAENEMYQLGLDNGKIIGFKEGYRKGTEDSTDFNLLSLINAIAKAPFTFIDSAFNFTIFGINVANGIHTIFTLGIIGLVVYAVIKLII